MYSQVKLALHANNLRVTALQSSKNGKIDLYSK